MEAPDYDQLRRRYSLCTNEEVERLATEIDGLTSEARDALKCELRQRGLEDTDASPVPIHSATQLPLETEPPRTSRWSWIWPVITNEKEAQNAAKSGAYGALFVALCTGGLSILAIATGRSYLGIDGYGLVDALLFALIAWGLYRYSFPWAVFGLLLWLAEVYSKLSSDPRTIGAMTIIVTLSLIASVRGTSFLNDDRKLKRSGVNATDTPVVAVDSAQASAGSRSFRFQSVPAVIICVVLLATVAYHQERIKEKSTSAALIAQLDNAEYKRVGDQIWKDIAALEEDYKGKDWNGFRRELLSRETYLIDLKAQNHEIQPRLQTERIANLGAKDICERLALDELGPAVEAFTQAQDNLFSFARNTPKLTTDNASASQLLGDQETSAEQQLNRYIADNHSHGCDK